MLREIKNNYSQTTRELKQHTGKPLTSKKKPMEGKRSKRKTLRKQAPSNETCLSSNWDGRRQTLNGNELVHSFGCARSQLLPTGSTAPVLGRAPAMDRQRVPKPPSKRKCCRSRRGTFHRDRQQADVAACACAVNGAESRARNTPTSAQWPCLGCL